MTDAERLVHYIDSGKVECTLYNSTHKTHWWRYHRHSDSWSIEIKVRGKAQDFIKQLRQLNLWDNL